MSTNKKTRGDSLLGTLTEDRQAEIAGHAQTHTLAETAAWLKADGLKISSGNLSRWLSGWRLRSIFTESESDAAEFRNWLARECPSMDEAELDRRAALMFQFKAVKTGDGETWLEIAKARSHGKLEEQKIAQRDRQLDFDQKKFEAQMKGKIDLAFDELEKSFKSDPEALKHFNLARDLVRKKVAT